MFGVLFCIGAAACGIFLLSSSFRARTLKIAILTDFYFRDARPDWQARVKSWFQEVNRAFAPAGIQWAPVLGGDAYPEQANPRLKQTLEDRRRLIAETASQRADVVLALTGEADPASNASVAPFGHAALVIVGARDADAIAITNIVRSLSNLFGVGVGSSTVVQIENPASGLLDPAAIRLIRTLRGYDFARGAGALDAQWQKKALSALETAFAGGPLGPEARARRTLARAFAAERRHSPAAEQYRLAVAAAPRDAALRFEYAMELEADARADDAVSQLREVLRLEPDNARAHAAIGAIYLNNRRTDQAIDELRAATRLEPADGDYQSVLGSALAAEVGRGPDAIAAFQAALRLKAADEGALNGLSAVAGEQASGQAFVRQGLELVRQQPNSAESHLRLGLAYAAAGDLNAAAGEFQRAAELDPKDGLAHLAMARLRYLRGQYSAAEGELNLARERGAEIPLGFLNALDRKLGRD